MGVYISSLIMRSNSCRAEGSSLYPCFFYIFCGHDQQQQPSQWGFFISFLIMSSNSYQAKGSYLCPCFLCIFFGHESQQVSGDRRRGSYLYSCFLYLLCFWVAAAIRRRGHLSVLIMSSNIYQAKGFFSLFLFFKYLLCSWVSSAIRQRVSSLYPFF